MIQRVKEPRLTDFDAALGIQQNIIGFDIAMNDTLTMKVAKTFARLQWRSDVGIGVEE